VFFLKSVLFIYLFIIMYLFIYYLFVYLFIYLFIFLLFYFWNEYLQGNIGTLADYFAKCNSAGFWQVPGVDFHSIVDKQYHNSLIFYQGDAANAILFVIRLCVHVESFACYILDSSTAPNS
jgi:hypothetical protein